MMSIRQVAQIGVRRLRPGCTVLRILSSGSTHPGRGYSTGWKAGDDSGEVDGVLTDLPALIFDLDGTLVETLPDVTAAVNHTLEGAGKPPLDPSAVRGMIGDGVPTLVKRAFSYTGDSYVQWPAPLPKAELEQRIAEFTAYYTDHACVDSHLFDGVSATLAELQRAGWPLGICTNKPAAPAKVIVEALGLSDYFPAATVVAGDSIPVKKPNPGHLIYAVGCAGGDPDSTGCIMIGDGHNDIKVARAAGFPVVGCTWGYTRVAMAELGPDATIDRFDELPAALNRWKVDGRDPNRSM